MMPQSRPGAWNLKSRGAATAASHGAKGAVRAAAQHCDLPQRPVPGKPSEWLASLPWWNCDVCSIPLVM